MTHKYFLGTSKEDLFALLLLLTHLLIGSWRREDANKIQHPSIRSMMIPSFATRADIRRIHELGARSGASGERGRELEERGRELALKLETTRRTRNNNR